MFTRVLVIVSITTGLTMGSAATAALLMPIIQKVRESASRLETSLAELHGPGAVAAARSHGVAVLPPGKKTRTKPAEFKKRMARKPGRMKDGTSNTILVSEKRIANSLRQLTIAIRQLEKAAGSNAPCVKSCRKSEQRCLRRCRGALKGKRANGRCSCIPGKARCLINAAERGKCRTSGDRGRFIQKRPGRLR